MVHPPSGTVTFLFTDIEGSTKLWEEHPEAMPAALARHDALLRTAIETNNGYIFKTIGDAFCAAFANATDALNATLAAQRALAAEVWGSEIGPLKARMALHTGSAEERDNDYFGPTINRIARLMAGYGGQILLSATTQTLVAEQLPPQVELRDLGEHRLKDLIRPEHIFQVIAPDLVSDFPMLKTLNAAPTNLPVQLTSFIGRDKEIAEVRRLVRAEHLITLVGSGGTGKTRLALQAAAYGLDSFPDGVWFVDLASISDPSFVPQAVATALELREEIGRPIMTTIIEALRTKTALLLLDNCEHLVEAAAQLTTKLLSACPHVRILASSREALGIPGETIYRVPSLAIPDPRQRPSVEALLEFESVRLFIDRAQIALPSFTINKENSASIAQICAQLDGIPLALELAAARVRMLRVEHIAARVEDRFRLLTSGSRTALPRQQTLRALIDWSYDLLSPVERSLLQRLSVFAGGWTFESAEAICSGGGIDVGDMLDLMSLLVNKSLVVIEREHGEDTRYRLLGTIRQYADEKLTAAGEREAIRDRHLSYFLSLAEFAEFELTGPDQMLWIERLETELDNIHTALGWSLERTSTADPPGSDTIEIGLRLASALKWYWRARYLSNGSTWLGSLIARPQEGVRASVRAKALNVQAFLEHWQTGSAFAQSLAEESLAIYRELNDRGGIAFSLYILGSAAFYRGDYQQGRQSSLESLALYRETGDTLGLAEVLGVLGYIIDNQNYQQSLSYLEESLTLYRKVGHLAQICRTLSYLGAITLRECEYEVSRRWLEEALSFSRMLGKWDTAACLRGIGDLSLRQGAYAEARACYEESLSLSNETINHYWVVTNLGYALLGQGELERAYRTFDDSQQHFQLSGSKIGVVYALEGLASLAVAKGHMERAARLFGWNDSMRETLDDRRPPVEQASVDRDLATIRTQLDEAAFSAAYAAGKTLTLEEAVAEALVR